VKLEARSAENGSGSLGALGRVCYQGWERCKLPQWGLQPDQPPRVLILFVFSDDLSCIENLACSVEVCHFKHCYHAGKSDRTTEEA